MLFLSTEVDAVLKNEGKLEESQVAVVVGAANEISSEANPMELLVVLSSRLGKLKVENLETVIGMIDEVAKVSVRKCAFFIVYMYQN